VNLAHTTAMTLWLGGLVLLLAGLSRGSGVAALLPPFSRLALGCVATLVLTGTAMAWREVGSPSALVATEYGRVLLAKLAAVALLLLLGDVSRRWVRSAGPDVRQHLQAERPRLRRAVRLEAGVAAAVLAATSALVVLVPAKQAAAPERAGRAAATQRAPQR
jgi:copper transport protein